MRHQVRLCRTAAGSCTHLATIVISDVRCRCYRLMMPSLSAHSASEKLAVVGVTGSAGKTTTSWLIRSIFEELGQLTGMLGVPSVAAAIGVCRLVADSRLCGAGRCSLHCRAARLPCTQREVCLLLEGSPGWIGLHFAAGRTLPISHVAGPQSTGSLEYAIAEDRLTDDGDLWEPPEEDPTLQL